MGFFSSSSEESLSLRRCFRLFFLCFLCDLWDFSLSFLSVFDDFLCFLCFLCFLWSDDAEFEERFFFGGSSSAAEERLKRLFGFIGFTFECELELYLVSSSVILLSFRFSQFSLFCQTFFIHKRPTDGVSFRFVRPIVIVYTDGNTFVLVLGFLFTYILYLQKSFQNARKLRKSRNKGLADSFT